MEDRERLAQLPARLLAWYDASARVLPWRENPTPYRVWVSEIMLQQTRVEAVKPYYERFLKRFPTVEALAAAPEERVLKLWEGLGYYSRARNLQRAAQVVVERYQGQVPASFEALRSLPGVGDFNQSLMELGAMVCLPGGAPKCLLCPLREVCLGFAQGVAQELPVKAKAKPRRVEERTVFLLFHGKRLALRKRPAKGLLAGLWELPSTEGALTQDQAREFLLSQGVELVDGLSPGPRAKHVFSHVEWHMTAWTARVAGEAPGFTWVTAGDLREGYALPSAFKAFFPSIEEGLKG